MRLPFASYLGYFLGNQTIQAQNLPPGHPRHKKFSECEQTFFLEDDLHCIHPMVAVGPNKTKQNIILPVTTTDKTKS